MTTGTGGVAHNAPNAIVWDNHACMPLRPGDTDFLPELARHRAAGFRIVTLNIGMDMTPWDQIMGVAETFRRWIEDNADRYVQIKSADDLDLAIQTDRLGVLFDLEGGAALDGKLERLEILHALGVRWMLFAYNQNNLLAGGCMGQDTGLTPFGRDVLQEINRLGIIPCCSHVGEISSLQIMEHSTGPVILSHANPRAVWDHARNVSDAVLDACAQTGGVVGINGVGPFLGKNDNSTEAFIRALDYAVDRIGADHVGLGLDFVFDRQELDDWIQANRDRFPDADDYASGMKLIEPERLPAIQTSLEKLGYSTADIRKIFGENWARVARQVW
ncbi:hypothetical protein GCM10017044_04530 [Kordiimonas sediminis]|uniref:Membrane dipeptidase n=1 Tax=Kordiimonas sediminis TaxID=1735581 RepID=A0A919ALK2_9PROT|nr:membrane dipeptidase [Kordiimonas sediminis]GHF13556.1 hypothetical protein GCM10017044_04530 [Kordiimonas sediminis]